MESANLTPPPDDLDSRLDALLREPSPALPDAGFSARVAAALPPPKRAAVWWSPTKICSILALAGSVAALFVTSSADNAGTSWPPLRDAVVSLAASLSDPVVLGTLALALVSVAYALRPLPRRSRHG